MDVRIRTLSLCMMIGLTVAWTQQGFNRKAYRADSYPYPWAPARRSAYVACAYTGEPCQTTNQCCSQHDVCLTSVKYSAFSGDKGRISRCQDVRKEMKYAKYAAKQLKASGQMCTDSLQCADLCCREVRGHRARYSVCGAPEDDFMSYTCIKASRTGNDVLDDLI